MFSTSSISNHANVTNVARDNITYEIVDDGTPTRTFEKVAPINERLKVDRRMWQ